MFRGDRDTPAGSQAVYVRDPLAGRCGALQSTVGLLDSCGSHVRACARRRRRPVGYGRDVDLQRRIVERRGRVPALCPDTATSGDLPGESQQIADVTLKRLQALDLDGLVLYDIDDESDRNPEERPFPFLPTMDPAEYLSSTSTTGTSPLLSTARLGNTANPTSDHGWAPRTPIGFCRSSLGPPHATSLWRRP